MLGIRTEENELHRLGKKLRKEFNRIWVEVFSGTNHKDLVSLFQAEESSDSEEDGARDASIQTFAQASCSPVLRATHTASGTHQDSPDRICGIGGIGGIGGIAAPGTPGTPGTPPLLGTPFCL